MDLFQALFKVPASAFSEGQFLFLTRLPIEALILAFVALAAVVWLMYRDLLRRGPGRSRWVLLGLRLAVVAILVFMLAVPALRLANPPMGAFTAVMVDTSRSMSITDMGAGQAKKARLDAAKELLGVGPA
ncbi:MAG: hypothetical protein NT049_19240 [Planctomycetota bacterium]|nr:hypothetical protein [Planctomycetota bacterium]